MAILTPFSAFITFLLFLQAQIFFAGASTYYVKLFVYSAHYHLVKWYLQSVLLELE